MFKTQKKEQKNEIQLKKKFMKKKSNFEFF